MRKKLLPICILKCSSFARWINILVALHIAMVEVLIQPPSPPIILSKDLEGHQGSSISLNRGSKTTLWHLQILQIFL